jgi:hypothetical protein
VLAVQSNPIGFLPLALGFVLLLFGINAGRKRRLLDDTPLSKTLGVFIGEVEVTGACVTSTPVESYLSERMCVLFEWSIDEQWERWETETYTDKDGNRRTRQVLRRGWTTVASNGHTQGFYLKDEFGFLWVHPKGADLETLELFSAMADRGDALYFGKGPDREIADSTGTRRFSERGLPVGTQLFVRGRASERSDIVAPQIVHDPKADMFLITPRKESEVSEGKEMAYWFCCLAGFACVAVGCALLGGAYNPWLFLLLGAYVVAWVGGWLWMVFNSLVGLRNRVRQAQSLIDVQLKRRADLIPSLVACLKGFRQYEADLQTTLAALRAQTLATGGVSAVGPALVAVTERYPEIKADESFRSLMKNLVETEDRIALARAYANDITTFYNTRLERIPDAYVARIIAMQPAALFVAEGFERKAVDVKFGG